MAHPSMTPPGRATTVGQSSIRSRHLHSPRPRTPAKIGTVLDSLPTLSPRVGSNRSSSSSYEIATPLLPSVAIDDAPPRPQRSVKRNPQSPPPTPATCRSPESKTPRRNSTQRRLDALKGLVANLDFKQPWSQSESRPQTPTARANDVSESCHSWRTMLGREQFERLDPLEIHRVEILWELCETEKAFMRSMRTVLRLFATPLKTPSGDWISGIPEPITELLDHLETISLAHGLLAAGLREAQKTLKLGDLLKCFRKWLPRLHEHEWYLVHFEPVVALVEDSARDAENVFGEFVRMQTKADDMAAMSLGSMLLKPVQRLMKYPLFWKRLLDITPHHHDSHSDLIMVLSETESIILTLQSAKAKEEDYQELLALEKRLIFDCDFQLAAPERKLLAQGIVIRVPGKELVPATLARASSMSSRSSVSSVSSFWDTRNSVISSQSSCSRSGSLKGVARSPSSTSITEGRRRREELQMFVFDDMVLLATLREGLFKSKKDRMWKVLPENEGGYGKLLEVKDWSGWGGHATLFTMTLPSTTVCLTLPATPRNKVSLSCPFLMSMPQVMSILAQACKGDDIEELQLGYAS